jgi:prepilin-type N-terminal cleavage/methylation domain-containing protein
MTHPIFHSTIRPPASARPIIHNGGARAVRRNAGRAGFTLAEILIASVVLLVGLLALTTAGTAIVRLEHRGRRLGRTAAAAESRFEILRALGCTAPMGAPRGASGGADGLEERWSVQPMLSRTLELVDSVTHEVGYGATRERTYLFRSAVRC